MNLNCFICDKELERACPTDKEINNLTYESIYDGGTVEISFGFGSIYDNQVFHGVICDDCTSWKNLYPVKSSSRKKVCEYGEKGTLYNPYGV